MGETQSWVFSQDVQSAGFSYNPVDSGAVTLVADDITMAHWKLDTAESRIEPNKWTLRFTRTDTATLDLKQGKSMVTYMAIMDNLTILAIDKFVDMRWKASGVIAADSTAKLAPLAEQETIDSAIQLSSPARGLVMLAAVVQLALW